MSRVNHVKSVRSVILKVVVFSLAFLVFGINLVKGQGITENFDSFNALPARGWFMQNNSVPVGQTGWFQGRANTFPAQAGFRPLGNARIPVFAG